MRKDGDLNEIAISYETLLILDDVPLNIHIQNDLLGIGRGRGVVLIGLVVVNGLLVAAVVVGLCHHGRVVAGTLVGRLVPGDHEQ